MNGLAEPSIAIDAGNSLANTVDLQIGKRVNSLYMNGKMDEVRVANLSRTTDWILTEYENQNSPSMFYVVSSETTATTLYHILPIDLLNFSATEISLGRIRLEFQTASEVSNDYFTIERSTNGADWIEVSKIDGAGNSLDASRYSIIDNEPSFGISYYRLQHTDVDGKVEYYDFKSVRISNSLNSGIKIYPNPTKIVLP